jgi:hypothetical protein
MQAKWDETVIVDLNPDSQNNDPWYCTACWEENKREKREAEPDPLYDQLRSLTERGARLGLDIPEDLDAPKRRKYNDLVREYLAHLHERLDPDLLQQIISTSPRPYPTSRPMSGRARKLQAVHGRRFEIAMLNFTVEQCACCGLTMPVQNDLLLDKGNCSGVAHTPPGWKEDKVPPE